jgi:GNAT superfamily N-acetyltransferase
MMRRVYPSPHGPEAVWSEAALLSHLDIYPEGQFVVLNRQRQVIAAATTMRVNEKLALRPHTWRELTGHGTLCTHDPFGNALYGVNIAVDPAYQGFGVARRLYLERIWLALAQGCRSIIAGARIPGFRKVAGLLGIDEYLTAVQKGWLFDPTLSKQLHMGFEVRGVLKDYAPDPETFGYAALIQLPVEGGHAAQGAGSGPF